MSASSRHPKTDRRKPKKKRVIPPPPNMTTDQVMAKIARLTPLERTRIKAYFLDGTFKGAAEKLGIDPHTVSDTVYRVYGFLSVLVDEVENTPTSVWRDGQTSQTTH